MITANSRYASATIVTAQNIDGNDILAIAFQEPADRTFQFTYHQVTDADFVDILAYRAFGDSRLWWIIANANPEITNWFSLVPGTLIRIPTAVSAVIG